MKTETTIQKINAILFDIQKNGVTKDYTNDINGVWDKARKELDKDTLKHQFMPVLKQIWKIA